MEEHLQQIRAALEASASAETRQAGVLACRVLLNALETAPVHHEPSNVEIAAASTGNAMAATAAMAPVHEGLPELCDPRDVPPAGAPTSARPAEPPLPPSPPPAPASVPAAGGAIDPAALAAIVTTIRSLSPDQWLELIIDKLRTTLRSVPTAPAAPMVPAAAVAFPQAAPQPLRFRFVAVPPAPVPIPKARR